MFKFNILEKLFDKLVSYNSINQIKKLAKKEGSAVEKVIVPNGIVYSYKTKLGGEVSHRFDKNGTLLESIRDVVDPLRKRLGIHELQFDNFEKGISGVYRTGPDGRDFTSIQNMYSKSKNVLNKQNYDGFNSKSELKIGENGSSYRKDISTPYGKGYTIEGDYKTPNGQQHCFRVKSDGFPPPTENEVKLDKVRKIHMHKFNVDAPGVLYSNMSSLAV